ncbi:hypothetical protein FJ957_26150 [Mesorhizobium sp. B2-4-6]|nr:hypothetical protein FJ957_26150 [Mesorhizobium sp. B2-4-6]
MVKLSDLGPRHAVTVHPQPSAKNDSDFYRCETCGQMVDCRDMRQVLWHEQDEHEALEMDA